MKGLLATQAPDIDGVCYINDFGDAAPRAGDIRRMRITEAHDYDLIGALIDSPAETAPVPVAQMFPILAALR